MRLPGLSGHQNAKRKVSILFRRKVVELTLFTTYFA
jgi:hypothetical protein